MLADPGGFASLAASHEDWLIPSGILGASVSGLISRSILNKALIGPSDFHGSVPVNHLADIDVSLQFVDRITQLMRQFSNRPAVQTSTEDKENLRKQVVQAVDAISARYSVENLNRIKPGIAEATRAALIHLCNNDDVQLLEDASLTGPFRAITLIEKTT